MAYNNNNSNLFAPVAYEPSASLYPPPQRCPSRQTGAIVTRHYDSGVNPYDARATQREAARRGSPLSVSALTTDLVETTVQQVKRHRIMPMTLALESAYWETRLARHRRRVKRAKEAQESAGGGGGGAETSGADDDAWDSAGNNNASASRMGIGASAARRQGGGDGSSGGGGGAGDRLATLLSQSARSALAKSSAKVTSSSASIASPSQQQQPPHEVAGSSPLMLGARVNATLLQATIARSTQHHVVSSRKQFGMSASSRDLLGASANDVSLKLATRERGVRGMQRAKGLQSIEHIVNPFHLAAGSDEALRAEATLHSSTNAAHMGRSLGRSLGASRLPVASQSATGAATATTDAQRQLPHDEASASASTVLPPVSPRRPPPPSSSPRAPRAGTGALTIDVEALSGSSVVLMPGGTSERPTVLMPQQARNAFDQSMASTLSAANVLAANHTLGQAVEGGDTSAHAHGASARGGGGGGGGGKWPIGVTTPTRAQRNPFGLVNAPPAAASEQNPLTASAVLPLHRETGERRHKKLQADRHVADFYRHLLPADVKYRARATHSCVLKEERQAVLKKHRRRTAELESTEPQSKIDMLIARIMHCHSASATSSGAIGPGDLGGGQQGLLQLNLQTTSRYQTQQTDRQQARSYYGVTLADVRQMRDEFLDKSDLAYLAVAQSRMPNSLGERLVDGRLVKAALARSESGADLTFDNLFRVVYGTGQKCLPVSSINHLLADLREEEELRNRHQPYSFRRFVTVTTVRDIEHSFEAILHFVQPTRKRVSQHGDEGITEDEYCSYMRRASSVMVSGDQASKLFRQVAVPQRSARDVAAAMAGAGAGARGASPRHQSVARSAGVAGVHASNAAAAASAAEDDGENISSSDAETIPSSEDEAKISSKKRALQRRLSHGPINVSRKAPQASDTDDSGDDDDDDDDDDGGDDEGGGEGSGDGGHHHHHHDQARATGSDDRPPNGSGDVQAPSKPARRGSVLSVTTPTSPGLAPHPPAFGKPHAPSNTHDPTDTRRANANSNKPRPKKTSGGGGAGGGRRDATRRRRRRRKYIVTVEEWALLILPSLREKVQNLKRLHSQQRLEQSAMSTMEASIGGGGPTSSPNLRSSPLGGEKSVKFM